MTAALLIIAGVIGLALLALLLLATDERQVTDRWQDDLDRLRGRR